MTFIDHLHFSDKFRALLGLCFSWYLSYPLPVSTFRSGHRFHALSSIATAPFGSVWWGQESSVISLLGGQFNFILVLHFGCFFFR